MQQYRLCGEDAIYLIFWIAPFHFRAGIKRVSIYASGAGRKLKCFTDWNGKEIVQASLKAARYYPSVSPTNLCEEKLIYALFFLEKLHLALIISFWNLIFSLKLFNLISGSKEETEWKEAAKVLRCRVGDFPKCTDIIFFYFCFRMKRFPYLFL